jgi:transposase-like protein
MNPDYPKDLLDFEYRFRTDADCLEYVTVLRWPDGFVCPCCADSRAWRLSRGRYKCQSCRRETSVLAGTLFQDSRKPLRFWFRALWYITSHKYGASALGLQRTLGLGSYVTAWLWLHKLRRAMVRPGGDRLAGRVEVDETYVGGVVQQTKGRSAAGKTLVAIAAQEQGAGLGRIRLQCLPNATKAALHGFVQDCVEPGSVVHTDGFDSYKGIVELGYGHEVTVLKGRAASAANELLPRVHLVASLLKRWLLGTHQGAVRPEHLEYYLDEFTFRFNRRTANSRGLLFYRLVQQALALGPITGKCLLRGKPATNHYR